MPRSTAARLGALALAALGLAACGDDAAMVAPDAGAQADMGTVQTDAGGSDGETADGETADAAIASLTREEFCTQFVASYAQAATECCSYGEAIDAEVAMIVGHEVCSYVLQGAMWESGELVFNAAAAQSFLTAYSTAVDACATSFGSTDLYSALAAFVTGTRTAGADCLDRSGGENVDGSYNYVCAPGLHCATTYPRGEGAVTATCVANKTSGEDCYDGMTSHACADGLACFTTHVEGVSSGVCMPKLSLGAACGGYSECTSGVCSLDEASPECVVPIADDLFCPAYS